MAHHIYGSLEAMAAQIQALPDSTPSMAQVETLSLTTDSLDALERRKKTMRQLEIKKKEREVVVPTNDLDVRAKLREMRHPITLFGEGPYERRMRLRSLLAELAVEGRIVLTAGQASAPAPERDQKDELFFTEGPEDLFEVRQFIARWSLPRAKLRVEAQKRQREELASLGRKKRDESREQAHAGLKTFSIHSSQVGGERLVSRCVFAPNGKLVLTGSWDNTCSLWRLPDMAHVITFKDHTDRITSVGWHPQYGHSATAIHCASGSADATVRLWSIPPVGSGTNTEDSGVAPIATSVGTLNGHTDKVNAIGFHPAGVLLASASTDMSWRLWDVEHRVCLQDQEGHRREVTALDFMCDGSIVCTGDASGLARVWDMRTGRTISLLEGHHKDILSISFSPNGYQLATGSADNSCKLWDLRKKNTLYTIPAHSNLVSAVKYQPGAGAFVLTASFDQTMKLWDSRSFTLIKTLQGNQSRVMHADVSPDSESIVSSSFDRTFKLWRKGAITEQRDEELPEVVAEI